MESVAVAKGAIFLDRDGVINVNRADHVKSWEEFEFLPGALESIRRLTQTGLPIFVITNQAIVNRKVISPEALENIHNRMIADVNQAGGHISKVYHCPHDTHEKCNCRKPEPGMLLQAAKEFDIDLAESFLIGDAWSDVEAGLTAGTRSILVMTGRGPQFVANVLLDYTVRVGAACDLEDAVTLVLSALEGEYIYATPRLRRSFHMALHPQEFLVL